MKRVVLQNNSRAITNLQERSNNALLTFIYTDNNFTDIAL